MLEVMLGGILLALAILVKDIHTMCEFLKKLDNNQQITSLQVARTNAAVCKLINCIIEYPQQAQVVDHEK